MFWFHSLYACMYGYMKGEHLRHTNLATFNQRTHLKSVAGSFPWNPISPHSLVTRPPCRLTPGLSAAHSASNIAYVMGWCVRVCPTMELRRDGRALSPPGRALYVHDTTDSLPLLPMHELTEPTSCAGLLASYGVAFRASAAAATRLAWLMAARHRARFARTLFVVGCAWGGRGWTCAC